MVAKLAIKYYIQFTYISKCLNYICIMKKVAFMFDDVCLTPDRQIGRHSHPQWELSHVICGAGTRTIGDLTEPMTEGEIILIPPGIPHVWQFDATHTDDNGNIANLTVFFETATLDRLTFALPETTGAINKIKSYTEALSLGGEAYNKVHDLMMAMRGITPNARVPKMIEILQTIAVADTCISAGRNNTLSRSEQRVERVRAFCNCNYSREISLEEIASHVGMNKSAFCTFMRRHTGKSLSEFVNDIRLGRAMEMLRHTDKNVAAIAYDTGFANVTYFNRLFRNKYNRTPKSIRTENYDDTD